jgi:peptidyl-prolyl cis-trans isomerase D
VEQEATLHDDELAAGATLEELAQNTDMQLGTIAWTGSNAEAIAGFESFRKAASEVTVDDYPAIANLEDGGIYAMRLDEVQEAAPYPFEDVRDRVQADWEADARVTQLLTRAEGLADQLTEGASFEDLDLSGTQATALSRTSFGANLPEDMLEAAFKLEPGQAAALRGQNGVYVLRLDEVLAADPEDERVNQLVTLFSQQAEQDVAEDLFRALALDIQSRAGVEIDQAAINAVHASFQ